MPSPVLAYRKLIFLVYVSVVMHSCSHLLIQITADTLHLFTQHIQIHQPHAYQRCKAHLTNTYFSISIPSIGISIQHISCGYNVASTYPIQCHIGKISPHHLSYTHWDKDCHPCCTLDGFSNASYAITLMTVVRKVTIGHPVQRDTNSKCTHCGQSTPQPLFYTATEVP